LQKKARGLCGDIPDENLGGLRKNSAREDLGDWVLWARTKLTKVARGTIDFVGERALEFWFAPGKSI